MLAVFVAILHFFIGPNYSGPLKDFLSGYLIDFILPFFLYFLFTIRLIQKKQKILAGLGILVLAFVIEYVQSRETALFGSTYDPYDFFAYLTGVISAILLDLAVLDKIIKKKTGSKAK